MMHGHVVRVDVDGVVADLNSEWLRLINAEHGCNVGYEDLLSWEMDQYLPPAAAADYVKWLHMPGLYNRVKPFPGAVEGVQGLRDAGYRVAFVTSSTSTGAGEKMEWLKTHGFLPKEEYIPRDYVSAHDKSLVAPGSFLIDDGPHNLVDEPNGIVFDQPWNREITTHPRVMNWTEVLPTINRIVAVGDALRQEWWKIPDYSALLP